MVARSARCPYLCCLSGRARLVRRPAEGGRAAPRPHGAHRRPSDTRGALRGGCGVFGAAKAGEDVVGKPDLGGPWTLVDSSGHFVSSRDLRGRYQLIYFGFSFCPDVCPQELEKISQVVEKLEARFGPQTVQPVYISVDPQRDTVAQMASYRRDFHPSLLALTGTPAQIKAVTRLFRVYYNQGLRTGEEDYLVDHSIITYLMDRRGQFLDFFGRNMTVEEIVHKVEKYIAADQKKDQQRKGARISDESGPASARPSGRGNP